jgi:hypothetical protein
VTTTEAWPTPVHAADLLHDTGDLAEALDVVASEAVLRTIQASGADVDSESAQAALAAAENWAIEASQELEGILQSARRASMTAAQPGYAEP